MAEGLCLDIEGSMQQNPPRVDLRPWFVALDELSGQVAWSSIFPNPGPIEIDVGCGRGLFLYLESVQNPERNYLGIEIDYREGRRTATRLKKRAAENARVWGGDARDALARVVSPGSVSVVHVYFPDPWWKRKHRRRRIFTKDFVDLVARVLEPGGLLSSATDVAEYFETMAGLMNHDPRFEPLPISEYSEPRHDMDYMTSFERKARQRGETISRGRWKLIGCEERT